MFDHTVQSVDNKIHLGDYPPLQNNSAMIFVSTSPAEDGELWKDFQTGKMQIEGVQKNQFVMLETIEQMFALTQHVRNVYTDRYHPGVLAHRLGKNVQLLPLTGGEQIKLDGLQQFMEEFPNPRVIQDERIPNAFQKLRDTLRVLRRERDETQKKTNRKQEKSQLVGS